MKHTPGPWRYQEESDGYTHIVRGPTGQLIHHGAQYRGDPAESDARLIAAAPDLLAALDRIHILAADGQLRASAQRTILEQISQVAQDAKAKAAEILS